MSKLTETEYPKRHFPKTKAERANVSRFSRSKM